MPPFPNWIASWQDGAMLRTMVTRAAILLLLCAGLVPALAQAQSWPTRPVRIVVPFSGAGTADLLTRIVADKLGAALGQPFVVEDRPGAGGIIGQESVMRSAPDGYTLVVSSLGSFVITPAFTPLPFDPFKDFTHIAYLGGQPSVMFVNKDLPQKTLGEFVAYARAHPGELTYGTISYGSQTQLVNEMLQKEAGIKMTYVPYRGANLIANDVLGGHLSSGSLALSAASGQLRAGTLRGLAIGTEERLPGFPDIPTFKEQGYPSLVSSTWFALSGPANLPEPIVTRLNAEVVKALHAPDVQARLESEAIDTKSLNAADFTAFFKQEVVRWTPIAKEVAAQAKAAGMGPP
jgi:tripartite-type tricarboxylate transporter receptor subunit TctC